MPLLDVTDAILDAMFMTAMTYTRRTEVLTNGVASYTGTPAAFYGVVTMERGNRQDQPPEASRVGGSIYVHTLTRLSDGNSGFGADLVSWNGQTYTVTAIDNYSQYGAGFICATCELKPLTDNVV